MKSRSILITTGIYPPEIGGPATYTFLVEHELRRRGWNVEVLPFREVRFLPKVVRHIVFFFLVVFCSFRKRYVYAQDIVSVGLPSLLATRIARKKFLVRVPGDFAWEQGTQRFGVKDNIDQFQNNKYDWKTELLRSIQKFVVKSADKVVVPSDYFYNLVLNWGVSKERLERIYNGVSVPEGLPEIEKREKVIVSAGRLVPWKGFDDILHILKDLPDYKLEIFGEGEDRDRLVSMARETGVYERVSFMGQVDRKTLLSHIKSASVFVLASKFESFSFQVVESMMVGTPVVSYDIGNLSEIIKTEVNGLLVPVSDIMEMKNAIVKICEDQKTSENFSKEAILESKRFSLENTVNELENILKNI